MFQRILTYKRKRKSGEQGFSVIEMSVVLLIIAIIAAFLVPQVINYMRKYRLGVAGRNVATAVQRARYLATSNNTRAAVAIDFQRVNIEQFDALGSNPDPEIKGLVQLPDGISISDDAPKEISFDGRGLVTPMPTQDCLLRINGPNGYYMIVTISPTGQISLSDTLHDDDA